MKKLISLIFTGVLLMAGTAAAGPYTEAGILAILDGEVNPAFAGWATSVVDYSPSDDPTFYGVGGIGPQFADPTLALGPIGATVYDIVSLGDMDADEIAAGNSPGSVTLGFGTGISNGNGYDFAVFENGFASGAGIFAELGYVEVSSNGSDFARFDSVSLTEGAVGGYGTIDPTDVHNLVGKHKKGEGTGFDLEDLLDNAFVLNGLVDLDNINYVRIVDIPGSGDFKDSLGNPIYDAWVTWGSGGVDLAGVGVINPAAVPVPAAVWLLGSGLACLVGLRRKS